MESAMGPRSGSLLIATGVLHELVGAFLYREELAEIGRAGVFGAVDSDRGPLAAALWFLIAGVGIILLGALFRWVETDLDRPVPARAGWCLAVLGALVVVPMPASGGWVFFPLAMLIVHRATQFAKHALADVPELARLIEDADHVDTKIVYGEASLREFVAAMLSYQPSWATALFGVRAVFVRLLGMRQERLPGRHRYDAETLPMDVGARAGFFELRLAKDDRIWAAGASERHLCGTLAVVRDTPDGSSRARFRVVTIVHYKDWSGPVYFNVIRPFHHLVVKAMARAGIREACARRPSTV
jgi:Protein of unknown function (DUF2867)/Family of unknown function (DUF6463)